MKRFSLMCVALGGLLLAGCSVTPSKIAVPLDTWPVQLGVGAQFIPASESWTLFRVAPLWWDCDRVCLATVAGLSAARAHGGVTVSGMNFAETGWGISVGAVVDSCGDHTGIRVGAINCGGKQDGLQVGLFNWCNEESHALQIGLLNWNGYFLFPLVNITIGGEDEEAVEVEEDAPVAEATEEV